MHLTSKKKEDDRRAKSEAKRLRKIERRRAKREQQPEATRIYSSN